MLRLFVPSRLIRWRNIGGRRALLGLLVESEFFSFIVVYGSCIALIVYLEHAWLFLHKQCYFSFFKLEEVTYSEASCFIELIVSLTVMELSPLSHYSPQHFGYEITRTHQTLRR